MDLREKTTQRAILCPWKEPKRGHKLNMPLVEFEPAIPMFENWGLRSYDRCSEKTRKLDGERAWFSLDLASKHPPETQMSIRDYLNTSKIMQVSYQFYLKITRNFFLSRRRTPEGSHWPVFVWNLQLSSNSEVVSCYELSVLSDSIWAYIHITWS
jgi:hypothetical protein